MAVSKVNEQDEKELGTEHEKEVGEAKAKPDLQHDQKDVVVVEANNATPDDTVDQVTAALKVKPKSNANSDTAASAISAAAKILGLELHTPNPKADTNGSTS